MKNLFRELVYAISRYNLMLLICIFGGQNLMAVNGIDLWLSNHTSTVSYTHLTLPTIYSV